MGQHIWKKMKYGDLVVNNSANDKDPEKCGVFVKHFWIGGRCEFGDKIGPYVEMTDKKGNFWNVKENFVELREKS